jgi:SAM-dependent methyltransferase
VTDCCRPEYDAFFDERTARRELADYRHRGATGPTRELIDAIRSHADVAGAELLDIGGGVGVIAHELVAAGAARVTAVDLSHGYLDAARDEAMDRGYADRADYRYGDFVAIASEIGDADIVTLDHVICCYPDWRALVAASVAKARRLYGVVYPLNRPWWYAAAALGNVAMLLSGSRFRLHIHSSRAIDAFIRDAGFVPRHQRGRFLWRTVLYERVT